MLSFDYLKGVYIIFIQQMRYKNSHKKVTLVEKHTNHSKQTLKLSKYEEKINYLHDFWSQPSIWILHINS